MNDMFHIIFRLLNIRGIGTVQANRILLSIQSIYNQSSSIDIENAISNLLNETQKKDFFFSNNFIEVSTDYEIEYYSILDTCYPVDLKKTLSKNAPTVVSTIGNIGLLKKNKVGFCGSRKASDKGMEVAKDCVEQLVEQDIVIVSGYAAGIDEQTHLTALKNGGSTIIVLPEGINGFRVKKELKAVWDWDRVLVISEFPPSAIWSTGRAMQRNNTIIALSDVMILIEAGETGGSMEAGKKTIELGKYLFAPIYQGIPEIAKGNQILLNKGAFPLKKSSLTMKANLSKVFEFIQKRHKYELL